MPFKKIFSFAALSLSVSIYPDLSSSKFPQAQVLGSVTSGGLVATGIATSGTTCYIANSNSSSLGVLDITNPRDLKFIRVVSGSLSGPWWVEVSGTTCYVLDDYFNSVEVFDITVPSNPVSINQLALTASSKPRCMAIQGTTGYISNRLSTYLNILDLSIPSSPSNLAVLDLGSDEGKIISTYGTTCYIVHTKNPGFISVLSLAPGTATLLGTVSSGGSDPFQMAVTGTTGYAACQDTSIGILDLSIPSNPHLVGRYTGLSNSPRGIAIQGGMAYLASLVGTQIDVMDVTVPGSISFLSNFSLGATSYLFSLSGTSGFVTCPMSPGTAFSFYAPIPYIWTNGSSTDLWNANGNWAPGTIPTTSDNVFLYTNGTSITLGTASASNLFFNGYNSFTLENGTLTLSGTLIQSNGSQTLSAPLIFSGGGTCELLGGILSIQNVFSGSTSSLALTGTGFYNISTSAIVASGDNKLSVSLGAGKLFNEGLVGSATSAFSILGANIDNLSILGCNNATFTIRNATVTNSGIVASVNGTNSSYIELGNGLSLTNFANSSIAQLLGSSTANILISGASITTENKVACMQDNANGSVTIDGAYFNIIAGGRLAAAEGASKGTFTIKSGVYNNSGHVASMQDRAQGSIKISDGSFTNNLFANLVYLLGTAQANISILGGTFNNSGRLVSMRDDAQGIITISKGAFVNDGEIALMQVNSQGSITFSGGSFSNDGSMAVANQNSKGFITITGGEFTNKSLNGLLASAFDSSNMVVKIQGGTFNNYGAIAAAQNNARGSFTITGGSFTNYTFGNLLGYASQVAGSISVAGGTFYNNGQIAPLSGSCFINFSGGDFRNDSQGLILNFFPDAKATVSVSGGFYENRGYMTSMQGNGMGFITYNGGSYTNLTKGVIANHSNSSVGTHSILGGTFTNFGLLLEARDTSRLSFRMNGGSITSQGTLFYSSYVPSRVASFVQSSSGDISINGGYIESEDYLSHMADTASGSVTISESAMIKNHGYMCSLFGNYGFITDLISFTGGSAIGTVTISGGFISNSGTIAAASGGSRGYFTMTSGNISNQNALMGFGVETLDIRGGRLELLSSSLSPFTKRSFTVSSSALISADSGSKIGPSELKYTGGSLTNHGLITLDKVIHSGDLLAGFYTRGVANSLISAALSGSGSLWVAGNATITAPVTQNSILVGWGGSVTLTSYAYTPTAVSGTLYTNSTLRSEVDVKSLGNFISAGTVIGSVTIRNSGHLSPGGLISPVESLDIFGNLRFDNGSILDIDFDATGNDFITIYGGNLSIATGSPAPKLNLRATGPVPNNTLYDLIKITAPGERLLGSTDLGSPFGGEFEIISTTPYLLAPQLYYSSTGIAMIAGYESISSLAMTPNQKQVAGLLDRLNGHTNACLQDKINQLLLASTAMPITEALDTLDPAELKGQELALEEMSFIMNNELSHLLYCHYKGWRAFASGGYEKLSQDSYSQYNGFTADAGYELIGSSYGFEKWQMIGALGALETSTDYKQTPAKSSSASVIANLGLSGFMKNFSFGLDGLFGYHFIHTSRTLLPYGLKALSNHGAYNIKLEAKGAYSHVWRNTRFIPYDQFGYNFMHENDFTEHGASCLDLHVRSSSRNMLRNTLGLRIETRVKREKARHIHIQPYMDAAWVWENRYSGQSYTASFVNTSETMTVQGLLMTRNFGKFEAGFIGSGKKWTGKANFNGMWGSRFYEMGASFTLDRRF